MRIIFTKKFLVYFIIGFFSLLCLIEITYFEKHFDEIFNKGLPIGYIFTYIYHLTLTLINEPLLFAILIASIFSTRYYSLNTPFNFKKNLMSGILIIVSFAIILFAFNNWIVPKSKLEAFTMLYEMKDTAPGEKIDTIDRKIFENSYKMITINQIDNDIDASKMRIEKIKFKCDSVLKSLPDSTANQIYNDLNLDEFGIILTKSSTSDNLIKNNIKHKEGTLTYLESRLSNEIKYKTTLIKEKNNRVIQPIKMILIFIIGISFGFIYNDQKSLLLFVLSTSTLGVFYLGGVTNLESLVLKLILGEDNESIKSLIVLGLLTSIFMILGLKKDKK